MAFSRGQALLAIDMQAEAERERKLFEEEQERMAQRGAQSGWGSLGLGLLGGALFGPAGAFIGQQIGRYGGRAMKGTGKDWYKTDFRDMYGTSDAFEKAIQAGKFDDRGTKDALTKLDKSDTASGDIFKSLGDLVTMGVAAGGPGALAGKSGSVGGLKELTTYGASGAGGKAGLLGGFVQDPSADVGMLAPGGAAPTYKFMSPKAQFKAGHAGFGQYGKDPKSWQIAKPDPTKGFYGPTGTAQFKAPFGVSRVATGGPQQFSPLSYALGMGMPATTTDPGRGSWLDMLYSQTQPGSPVGQNTYSNYLSGGND